MTHKKVYDWFKFYFPQFADQSKEYFPCGKNCIRVRLQNERDYVFTYNGNKNWKFETVESHIKSMRANTKGERQMKC